jgi:hypothetical protein
LEQKNRLVVERVQTGVRIEKRILKVLKAFAEYHDLSLGDLLEGIVLHSFEGLTPFKEESLSVIAELKRIYKLDLTASDSHQLLDMSAATLAGAETTADRKTRKGRKGPIHD